ncbi:hypothetical protein BpHYR1_008542 [Brachionus plicatilis]|uniref:Uncharacterized protein n=1 Tax=Brachionus plicatilis TaxID=10195 RepID=A0A3M7T544_BRAPC|nr:hypothetical protein BpHYR1_008542 [Brachionus plicatilis]
MLHSPGFDCLLYAFFEANLAASDDSTGTKAISLMKKIFDFTKGLIINKKIIYNIEYFMLIALLREKPVIYLEISILIYD